MGIHIIMSKILKQTKVSLSRFTRSPDHKGRWRGLDEDVSDDQQDITRGRDMVDSLYQGFQGVGGTHNAILNSTDYLSSGKRSFSNIEDGFYISPEFLDKMTVHIAKNFMELPKIKIPLILGIWGGKGQGKTFQTELGFKKLGISPVVMSAGELESGNAGEPAKLVRQRYREASDVIKKGKMCSLFINDLDAGAGRLNDSTQYTVNNQMVNATLMNIADNPTNVQLPGMYNAESVPRVPIICTGNDFSTLYAPLIRDGRMEKFYWNPSREDRVGVCLGIFQQDSIARSKIEKLVDNFSGQSMDFFGALRARIFDEKIRDFISSYGIKNLSKQLINRKDGKLIIEKPTINYRILMFSGSCKLFYNTLLEKHLLIIGNLLVNEQENVKHVQLCNYYLTDSALLG